MKLHKIEWPILAASIIALAAFLVALAVPLTQVYAGTLPANHNEQVAAIQAASDDLIAAGCLRPYAHRLSSLVRDIDPGDPKAQIVSVQIKIECTKWGQVSQTDQTHSVLISWNNASTRADGTSLLASQIASVEIYQVPSDNTAATKLISIPTKGSTTGSATISGLSPGTYRYALTSVDTDGQESALSQIVSVTIP